MIATIFVKTTLRGALDKMPGALVALFIEEGFLESWPLELTQKGKRFIKVVYRR